MRRLDSEAAISLAIGAIVGAGVLGMDTFGRVLRKRHSLNVVGRVGEDGCVPIITFGGDTEGDGPLGGFAERARIPVSTQRKGSYQVDTLGGVEWEVVGDETRGPSRRYFHSAAWVGSERSGYLVVFGGFGRTTPDGHQENLDDLHLLSLDTMDWVVDARVEPDPSAGFPCGRSGHVATRAGENGMLIFGGYSGSSRLNDVWLLTLSHPAGGGGEDPVWVWEQVMADSALPPSPAFQPELPATPPATCNTGAAYVGEKDTLYVFSGHAGVYSSGSMYALSPILGRGEENGAVWSRFGGEAPSRRVAHTMVALDGNRLAILGGEARGIHCIPLLLFSIDEEEWSEVLPHVGMSDANFKVCFHGCDAVCGEAGSGESVLFFAGGSNAQQLRPGFHTVYIPPPAPKSTLASDLDAAYARGDDLVGALVCPGLSGAEAHALGAFVWAGNVRPACQLSFVSAVRVANAAPSVAVGGGVSEFVACVRQAARGKEVPEDDGELEGLAPATLVSMVRLLASTATDNGAEGVYGSDEWVEEVRRTRMGALYGASVERGEEGDFSLISSEGARVLCHRFVLGARSGFFRALFSGPGWAETESGELELRIGEAQEALGERTLRALLRFLYTGEVDDVVSDPQVAPGLMEASRYLQIESEVLSVAVATAMTTLCDGDETSVESLVDGIVAARAAGVDGLVPPLLVRLSHMLTSPGGGRGGLKSVLSRLEPSDLVDLVVANTQ